MKGVSNNCVLNRMSPLTIKLDPLTLSNEQFYQLCQNNRDLRFERTCRGDLVIMPPTGGETGERNSEINYQLRYWNKQSKRGKVFDSSNTGIFEGKSNRIRVLLWVFEAFE